MDDAHRSPNGHDRRWPPGPLTELVLRSGRLVVAKQRPPGARWATEAEGRWLAGARHPGVVPLRLVAPETGLVETVHRGQATLRTAALGPAAAARVLAGVATTLADLHRRGLVHGQLWPEHVVLSGSPWPTPVLCSPAPAAAGPDPAAAGPDPAADLADLARLARMVRRAAQRPEGGVPGRWPGQRRLPEQRRWPGPGPGRGGWTGGRTGAWAGGWDEVIGRLEHDPLVTARQAAVWFSRLERAPRWGPRLRPWW